MNEPDLVLPPGAGQGVVLGGFGVRFMLGGDQTEGRFALVEHPLEPGTLVTKPRGLAHTFWNAGAVPARVLELISPAGFERYFEELAPLVAHADLEAFPRLWHKYGLRMDLDSLARLAEEHGVRVGEPPPGRAPGQ